VKQSFFNADVLPMSATRTPWLIITIDTNPHRPFTGVPFLGRRGVV
jgi:hypothetical protein